MSNFVNNLLYDNVHQGHFTNDLKFFQTQLSSPEHAPAYMMAANTGVIKVHMTRNFLLPYSKELSK